MRRKVNNTETHETKRYYEVPSEKVQEWSDTIENLTKQRDQYKIENEKLHEELLNKNRIISKRLEESEILSENEKLSEQYNKMIAERNSLIDDLPWYKAKVSRLERELSAALDGELAKYDELQYYVLELQSDLKECQKENEKLNNITEEAMDIAESENYKAEKLGQENVGLKLMNESSNKQLEIFHRCFNSLLTKLDINKDKDNLLSEISQHIGNKPSSSTYKYFRAKLNGIGIKEGE